MIYCDSQTSLGILWDETDAIKCVNSRISNWGSQTRRRPKLGWLDKVKENAIELLARIRYRQDRAKWRINVEVPAQKVCEANNTGMQTEPWSNVRWMLRKKIYYGYYPLCIKNLFEITKEFDITWVFGVQKFFHLRKTLSNIYTHIEFSKITNIIGNGNILKATIVCSWHFANIIFHILLLFTNFIGYFFMKNIFSNRSAG